MKERNGSILKGIFAILIIVITILSGLFIEKARLVNRGEMFAAPAGVTSCEASGAASKPAAVQYGPEEQKKIENKYGRIRAVRLPAQKSAHNKTSSENVDKPEEIASYFQGSASWGSGLTWSGDWGEKRYGRKKFGAFGCGLCAMANIYVSLTPYNGSPLDMYRFAKESSHYPGAGAIDWWSMETVLEKAGFTCETGNKPKEYAEFQRVVRRSKAMIILVSNDNKKSMWKETKGHYAALFLYDSASDKVFLTDSGSYERNRKWVPLKKIYHSLKTRSERQYLSVTSYQKKNDTWRNTRFTGTCNFPTDWRPE